MLRGGAFNNEPRNLRGAYRNDNHPDNRNDSSKDRPLYRANRLLDQLRPLLRLAADVDELTARQLEFVSARNEELGRMIGGWIKASLPRRSEERLSDQPAQG